MATTRLELRVSRLLLAGALSWPCLHAVAQTAPAVQVQPTLDLMVSATNNANGLTATAPARRDVIVSTGAGLIVNAQGANARAEGQFRLTSVKYMRDTQPSQVVPSGQINLHTDLYRKEVGVDSSVSAEQLALTPGTQPDATNTANTITSTRFRLSPFYTRQFDNDVSLRARLNRTWIRSESDSQVANTNNNHGTEDKHEVRLERRPARLGYALDASYSRSPVFSAAGSQNDTSLTRRIASASLLYVLTPEVVAGVTLGRESSNLDGVSYSGTVRGVELRWRPNERTQLKSVFKRSVFGSEWDVDASRKTPWTTFGLNARRSAEAQTPQSTAASSNLGVSPAPVSANVQGAVLRDAMLARMSFVGRRDTVNLSAGLGRSSPLNDFTGLQSKTKERFFDTELIHRLTPVSNLAGGLRWTRGKTIAANGGLTVPSRDFSARLGVDTRLTLNTTATMGFRRQITRNATTTVTATSNASSVVYVGLNHRF